MFKKKNSLLVSILFVMSLVLAACGNNEEAANPMSYIGIEEVKQDIESGAGEYILLDNRKAEDYEDAHIKGAIMADVDAANKGGDDDAGIASLEAALLEATGNAAGDENAKYALLCYSGKSYAQKAT